MHHLEMIENKPSVSIESSIHPTNEKSPPDLSAYDNEALEESDWETEDDDDESYDDESISTMVSCLLTPGCFQPTCHH